MASRASEIDPPVILIYRVLLVQVHLEELVVFVAAIVLVPFIDL